MLCTRWFNARFKYEGLTLRYLKVSLFYDLFSITDSNILVGTGYLLEVFQCDVHETILMIGTMERELIQSRGFFSLPGLNLIYGVSFL
jgi:hypothetical protein